MRYALSASMVHGIDPIDSITGCVHLITSDVAVDVTNGQVFRKKQIGLLFDDHSKRMHETFCVNRVYWFNDKIHETSLEV